VPLSGEEQGKRGAQAASDSFADFCTRKSGARAINLFKVMMAALLKCADRDY